MTAEDAEFEHRFTHPYVGEIEKHAARVVQKEAEIIRQHYVLREDVQPLLIALAYYAEISGTTARLYDDGSTARKAIEQARLKGLL